MGDDIFENLSGDFDAGQIALEEMAKVVVPMFRAFTSQGLPPQEAAALTAAIISQGMPMPPPKPKED